MDKIPKEIEYKKPYRFYLICDKLCDLEGVEVKNQMIADSVEVSIEEFINNCAYSESLLEYENINEISDPSMGFYKSKVKDVPCYYVQYAGFEFIFIGNGLPDKEYWLEEMYNESYEMKHIKLFENFENMTDEEFDSLSSEGIYKIDINNEYGYVLGEYNEFGGISELKIIHIYDKYRKQGHSRKLMSDFIEKSKEMGANEIFLEVESVESDGLTDEQLYNFYETFGFKRTRSNEMILSIE